MVPKVFVCGEAEKDLTIVFLWLFVNESDLGNYSEELHAQVGETRAVSKVTQSWPSFCKGVGWCSSPSGFPFGPLSIRQHFLALNFSRWHDF